MTHAEAKRIEADIEAHQPLWAAVVATHWRADGWANEHFVSCFPRTPEGKMRDGGVVNIDRAEDYPGILIAEALK